MKQGIAIALHGGDHKTGVTMLTQCIAEHLAEHLKDQTVVQASLQGNPGGDYCQASVQSVEGMRSYLEQNVLNCGELLRECKVQERLYLVRGIWRPEQRRLYHPEVAVYLTEQLRREAAFVVADTRSEAHDGLAVGALGAADLRCLVLTQQGSVIARWERSRGLYRRLRIDFSMMIIDRYLPEATYTKEYMAERLGFPPDCILTVDDSPYGARADGEKKSLLKYRDERFRQGIDRICRRFTEYAGLNYSEEKRWRWWKNSI